MSTKRSECEHVTGRMVCAQHIDAKTSSCLRWGTMTTTCTSGVIPHAGTRNQAGCIRLCNSYTVARACGRWDMSTSTAPVSSLRVQPVCVSTVKAHEWVFGCECGHDTLTQRTNKFRGCMCLSMHAGFNARSSLTLAIRWRVDRRPTFPSVRADA